MREVTSNTIKAYARSLDGIIKGLKDDLEKLGLPAAVAVSALLSAKDAILLQARFAAESEFEKEWAK